MIIRLIYSIQRSEKSEEISIGSQKVLDGCQEELSCSLETRSSDIFEPDTESYNRGGQHEWSYRTLTKIGGINYEVVLRRILVTTKNNRASKTGLSFFKSLMAIMKEQPIVLDPGGKSSSRTYFIGIIADSRLHALSVFSHRIQGSSWSRKITHVDDCDFFSVNCGRFQLSISWNSRNHWIQRYLNYFVCEFLELFKHDFAIFVCDE